MRNTRFVGSVMSLTVSVLLITLLIVSGKAYADGIIGTGFGKTMDDAKKEALAELSQNIRVEVKSEFTSIQTVTNKSLDEYKGKVIHLKSELPLYGVQYNEMTSKQGFMVEAVLPTGAVTHYDKELAQTAGIITKNLQALKAATNNAEKASFLRGLLTKVDQYYSLRIVAQFLKSTHIPEIPVTTEELSTQLKSLEKKADSLDFGIQILTKSFTGDRIYIYPPTPENSSEVTQFSSAVKDHLSKRLKTVISPDQATSYMTGTYKILKDGIELTCTQSDKSNKAISTGMAFFLPQAYAGYTTEPVSVDFEKLVETGYIVTSDFKAELKTDKGKRDLLFMRGDTMKIMVKMNKPGYFYLISHNFKKSNYSYIINFNNEEGNRKFVYYVNGDFVNKWVELGEFEVVPPFGVETLQLVASTQDLVESVPATFYDKRTELYTIAGGDKGGKSPVASMPDKALVATRALVLKKKNTAVTTEAALVFTSMDKSSR